MNRLAGQALIVVALTACFMQGNKPAGGASTDDPAKLDGVYEFVSETTVLVKPKEVVNKRAAPEWVGLWQLRNGHYSRVLMKSRRDEFFDPKNFADLGFESFAGPYELKAGSVMLIIKSMPSTLSR